MALSSDATGPLTAQELVNEMWTVSKDRTNEWVAQLNYVLPLLNQVNIEPISFSVDYNVDAWLPQFTRPTRPETPEFNGITAQNVDAPELDPVAVRLLGDAPAEPDFTGLLGYTAPDAPTQPMPTAPSDVTPALDPIDVPLRPDYVLPEAPTLFDLQLPEFPTITLPEFDGVRPNFDIPVPADGALEWQEQAYNSPLQADMLAKIRDMLQGGTGLPYAVERAIFDRGRAREDQLSRKQVQEISEDMASRNMSEPNGILGARLQQAREANRDAAHGLNRDLTIRVAEIGIENVKFALGQGMVLEQTLVQLNQSINDRALRAAIFVREYGISRLNALVALANLQQQAYATDAQVWRQRIEGELSKLEVLKAQIEAQRLIGDINRDLVARYEAGISAVKALAEFYKTDVDAAETKSRINVQRIEAAKLVLDRYSTEVDAWGKLQDAYKNSVEASMGKVRFAEVLASVFATRMNGYRTKGEAYFQEGRFQIDRNQQSLSLFESQLRGADQDLRAQLAVLDGQLRAFGAQTNLYQADGVIAQAESAALDRSVQLKIENERNRADTALKQADIRIQQALRIAEILVEQIKTKASVLSQLVAASESGVNAGASLSGSLSTSFGHSRSLAWSGEVADHSGIGY